MADFTSIWLFVERDLKVQIPPYIKNVLMACGYENCYTISTIDESDLDYFQSEVRKGRITKFFNDERIEGISQENVLEGSTFQGPIEEFELSRGHQKLMMSIAQSVRENLNENGLDAFLGASKSRPKKTSCAPRKRMKLSPGEIVIEFDQQSPEDVMKFHQNILVRRAMKILKTKTPEMYEKNLATIETAATNDLVTVRRKVEGKPQCLGAIKCPYCKKNTNVFHVLGSNELANELGTWNVGNFSRHLLKLHTKNPMKQNHHEDKHEDSAEKLEKDEEKRENQLDESLENFEEFANPLTVVDVGSIVEISNSGRITSSLIVLPSLVNYSDTDGDIDETDDNVPKFKVLKDFGKTFNVCPNSEDLENIEEEYLDSSCLNESDDGNFHIKELAEEVIAGRVKISSEEFPLESKVEAASSIEKVLLFTNGYKSKDTNIYTVNTCAFDSIFFVYSVLYFDYPAYRDETDFFLSHSNFSELIKKHFEESNSKSEKKKSSDLSDDLYNYRNYILKEIFSVKYYQKSDNIIKNKKHFFIDCATGIGGFFGQICFEMGHNLASAIELKICYRCQITKARILPFVSINPNEVNLCNIQKSINLNRSKEKTCLICGRECGIKIIYNNVLIIETEPNIPISFQRTVSIHKLTKSITVGKKYELFGVIQYKPRIMHFVSHVKRNTGGWKTFDDLNSFEIDTDTTEEILPYMQFYARRSSRNEFAEALLSFFDKNKLRTPMTREISHSERMEGIHTNKCIQPPSQLAKMSLTASSTAEWKKKREKEWKY